MKITNNWLEKHDACGSGIAWFNKRKFKSDKEVIKQLVKENRYIWATWALARLLEKKDVHRWAIYCASLVLPIFEKEYPDDKRPRKAIEAARKVLESDTKKNRDAVFIAAVDAVNAACTAYDDAFDDNAYTAAEAARAATCVADGAYRAACSYAVAVAANKEIKTKIINYGLKLIKGEKDG